MPNGDRHPYHDLSSPPSPLHTSDSEDTWVNKHRWSILARWVLGRWRAVVDRSRRRRRLQLQRCLMYNKLLPRTARVACVVETIAAYFPFVARGVGARGDSNHARSLWRSLCRSNPARSLWRSLCRDAACLQPRETTCSPAH